MELELKHIQHYPIGGDNALNVTDGDEVKLVDGIYTFDNKKEFWFKSCGWNLHRDSWKPLLLPTSSLYTEITHNGKTFIPQKELDWGSWNDEIGYIVSAEYGENPRVAINVLDFIDDYYKLLEWHFDVFGLIDKGLALLSDAKDFTLTVKDNENNNYVLVFCDYGNELEIVKESLIIHTMFYEKLKSEKDE